MYTITPLMMGWKEYELSEAIYRRHFGVLQKNCFVAYLLRSGSECILVDSGPPRHEEAIKRPIFPTLNDYVRLDDALAKEGVKPEQISKVILSHLHWDHCWNLDLFPQAKVYVQKKEINYAVAPVEGSQDVRMYGALPECGTPGWFEGWSQMVRVDGDVEIMPGINVILTPGHSPGSQCVLVDTKEGKYLLPGDFIPKFENFRDGVPNGIIGNMYDWFASYHRIKNLTPNCLPAHDMGILDRKVYG